MALKNHAPLIHFDPYLTMVVAVRESGGYIFSRRRRLEVNRREIINCRNSNNESSGSSRPCMGACRPQPPSSSRPVTCYDTFWRGGLDNLGDALPNWRRQNWIPPDYDSGGSRWEVGLSYSTGEGGSGGADVLPGFVPSGELVEAYAVNLHKVTEQLIAQVANLAITMTPLDQLQPFFRRFLTQVAFGGPGGDTSFHQSRLDCDTVINSRPIRQYCIKPDGTRHTLRPSIRRDFVTPWRNGIACEDRPAIFYGIRTLLSYLKQVA
ncbi:hypothetical protein N9J26_00750 [bacterium]|nr:hypothetical protein [bacterium]